MSVPEGVTGTIRLDDNGGYVTPVLGSLISPEPSEWTCYLFGSDVTGLSWTPYKGKQPNWFWRQMQFLILGNRWVKK